MDQPTPAADPLPPRTAWFALTQVMAGLLALSGIYFGAYMALLERKVYRPVGVDSVTGQNLFECEPSYRIRTESVRCLLAPAQRIDSVLRGDYWETIEHSSGFKWRNPPSHLPPAPN